MGNYGIEKMRAAFNGYCRRLCDDGDSTAKIAVAAAETQLPAWWPGDADSFRAFFGQGKSKPRDNGRWPHGPAEGVAVGELAQRFAEVLERNFRASRGGTPPEVVLDFLVTGQVPRGYERAGDILVDKNAPSAPSALVNEALRLQAALQQNPEAMQRFDAAGSGQRHYLNILAGGALEGGVTHAAGLCREARAALGELPAPVPTVKAGPPTPGPSLNTLAAEARELRRHMRPADYKELALQAGSNTYAAKRDLEDVERGRQDGSIAAKVLLVDLAKKVLEARRERVPAGVKR